jgi:hypothetical protein
MSTDKLKLLLAELEVEVVQEALELYVQTRPVPNDRRFEYRYRAARSVLESLRQGTRELGTVPQGDDEEAALIRDERAERRPLRDRVED